MSLDGGARVIRGGSSGDHILVAKGGLTAVMGGKTTEYVQMEVDPGPPHCTFGKDFMPFYKTATITEKAETVSIESPAEEAKTKFITWLQVQYSFKGATSSKLKFQLELSVAKAAFSTIVEGFIAVGKERQGIPTAWEVAGFPFLVLLATHAYRLTATSPSAEGSITLNMGGCVLANLLEGPE